MAALVGFAVIWATGAIAFFAYLVWALAETRPCIDDWLLMVGLSLVWPWSAMDLAHYHKGRRK